MNISQIVIPVRPQPDTILAIYLLQKFGQSKYPGVESARVIINPTPDLANTNGMILLDCGGGTFDHHSKTDSTASFLVARQIWSRNNFKRSDRSHVRTFRNYLFSQSQISRRTRKGNPPHHPPHGFALPRRSPPHSRTSKNIFGFAPRRIRTRTCARLARQTTQSRTRRVRQHRTSRISPLTHWRQL